MDVPDDDSKMEGHRGSRGSDESKKEGNKSRESIEDGHRGSRGSDYSKKLEHKGSKDTIKEYEKKIEEEGKIARLKQMLKNASAFSSSPSNFLGMLAESVQETQFEPGELIFHCDDECSFGTSPFYVVTEGRVLLQNELEVCFGHANKGDMFGEGGALGLVETRTLTARAGNKPVAALVLCGESLEASLITYPEERDRIEEMFFQRTDANHEFERQRDAWIKDLIVPALSETALFVGCPAEFLTEVSRPLNETSYKPGQTIATCGEATDSMLVILDGEADVESKSGAKIGRVSKGATFGEVSTLGLFSCRTATLKAVGKCRVLHVTEKAMSRALEVFDEPLVTAAFKSLAESRNEQVRKGLPLTALPIHAHADNVCVRAVSLQAERIDLEPGEIWVPLPDDDPCGPHLGILVTGRVLLETTKDKRSVTALTPGSLIPEGLCAEYRTHARAVTQCEAYRIRRHDFMVAVRSMASSQDWFYRYRLLEDQTLMHLRFRLGQVKGVSDVVMPHAYDSDIHRWKNRRERAIERSHHIKVEKGNNLAKLPLMAHSSPHVFLASEAGKAWRDEFYVVSSMQSRNIMSRQSTMSRMSSAPDLQSTGSDVPGRAVGAYPAMKLPSLEHDM